MAEDGFDEISFEILPDGSLKFETDQISGANHASAEQLLADISRGMGGRTQRQKQGNSKQKQKQKLKA